MSQRNGSNWLLLWVAAVAIATFTGGVLGTCAGEIPKDQAPIPTFTTDFPLQSGVQPAVSPGKAYIPTIMFLGMWCSGAETPCRNCKTWHLSGTDCYGEDFESRKRVN